VTAEPLVSVVIPAHNNERHLSEALDSVLAQTHSALDVIVVDDESTDGTRRLAQAYGPPVRVVAQERRGIGATRNHGVHLARGQLLAFLDADDVWEPRKLELQIAALGATPPPDIVFGHVRQFRSPGELEDPAVRRLHCPPGLQPGAHVGAMLLRRETFARVGPFPTHYRVADFTGWLVRARLLGLREVMLPYHVMSRRLHATNTALLRRASMVEHAHVLKAALDWRRAHDG
jgi:glycosyltransferase involved in cell wall biosynthesis